MISNAFANVNYHCKAIWQPLVRKFCDYVTCWKNTCQTVAPHHFQCHPCEGMNKWERYKKRNQQQFWSNYINNETHDFLRFAQLSVSHLLFGRYAFPAHTPHHNENCTNTARRGHEIEPQTTMCFVCEGNELMEISIKEHSSEAKITLRCNL